MGGHFGLRLSRYHRAAPQPAQSPLPLGAFYTRRTASFFEGCVSESLDSTVDDSGHLTAVFLNRVTSSCNASTFLAELWERRDICVASVGLPHALSRRRMASGLLCK